MWNASTLLPLLSLEGRTQRASSEPFQQASRLSHFCSGILSQIERIKPYQADFPRLPSWGFAQLTCSWRHWEWGRENPGISFHLVFHELKISLIKNEPEVLEGVVGGRGWLLLLRYFCLHELSEQTSSLSFCSPHLCKEWGKGKPGPLRAVLTGAVTPGPYCLWQVKLSIYKTLRSQECGLSLPHACIPPTCVCESCRFPNSCPLKQGCDLCPGLLLDAYLVFYSTFSIRPWIQTSLQCEFCKKTLFFGRKSSEKQLWLMHTTPKKMTF